MAQRDGCQVVPDHCQTCCKPHWAKHEQPTFPLLRSTEVCLHTAGLSVIRQPNWIWVASRSPAQLECALSCTLSPAQPAAGLSARIPGSEGLLGQAPALSLPEVQVCQCLCPVAQPLTGCVKLALMCTSLRSNADKHAGQEGTAPDVSQEGRAQRQGVCTSAAPCWLMYLPDRPNWPVMGAELRLECNAHPAQVCCDIGRCGPALPPASAAAAAPPCAAGAACLPRQHAVP